MIWHFLLFTWNIIEEIFSRNGQFLIFSKDNFVNSVSDSIVLKFIYSEQTTKFCEIFTLLLTGTT